MERIVIHGTGSGSENLLKLREENIELCPGEIVCFTDNDPQKQGTQFHGKDIFSPHRLTEKDYDFIIIASTKHDEIKRNLIEEYSIAPHKLYSKAEYLRKSFANYQYKLRYGAASGGKRFFQGLSAEITRTPKIVVYTANIGKYDILPEPLVQDDRIDYVCFTDDAEYRSASWHVEHVKNESGDAPLETRKYKFFPDRYFPEYEISVWVDSKFQIVGSLFEYVEHHAKTRPMLCFPHPVRNDIYEEAATCVKLDKVPILDISRQILHYYDEGFPKNSGMIEGGCITRLHHDASVKHVMQQWWHEINLFTRRDQISFPYVSWKNAFTYDICNLDIERCKYLQCVAVHRGHGKI